MGAIVPLQPHGTRPPVFALAGHNGDVFSFADLARRLGEDQPFFGLRAPGLDGHSEPLERAEDLGSYLAAQIRAFHGRGPHIIAGYCAGGPGAFEAARQLLHDGAEVSLLALFGCPHPIMYRFSAPYWAKRVVKHTEVLATLSSFEERREYVATRIRARLNQLRIERTPAGDDPESLMRFKFEQTTITAVRRYTPKPFFGRLCLFIPNRAWLSANGAALRWRNAAPRAEVYYGPDSIDPERMLVEPHVRAIATLFEQTALQAVS